MSAIFPTAKLSEIAELNPTLGKKLHADELISFVPMASLSADTAKVETTQDRPYSEVAKGFTPFLHGDVLFAKITPCFENGKIAQATLPRSHGFGSTEFHVIRSRSGVSDARYLHHYLRLGACRTWSVESENRPQRGQFLPDLQPHSPAMGQKDGVLEERRSQKWTAAADLQPTISKSDRLLDEVRVNGQRRMTGSGGQRRVPSSFLAELQVPVPPLAEQRRIAATLDQAETLRTQRRTALALLDSVTQSLFLDMFGDPVTNSKGWSVKPISALGKVVTGNTPPRDVPEYYGNLVEWIKSDNLNTPHYYVTKATESLSEAGKTVGRVVPPNSILVTCIAGSPDCIGNAAMADREVAFNQQINAFVPVELDAHFAYAHIVVGKKLIQRASTNGMKGMVSKSRFEAIEFMAPPLPLQQTFATRIQAIEAIKASHRAALAQLDALFASLQQRAFAGQL